MSPVPTPNLTKGEVPGKKLHKHKPTTVTVYASSGIQGGATLSLQGEKTHHKWKGTIPGMAGADVDASGGVSVTVDYDGQGVKGKVGDGGPDDIDFTVTNPGGAPSGSVTAPDVTIQDP